MKIAIDARMYGLEHAGIGRYVANLVREMKNLKFKIKNLEIVLLVRSKNLEEIKKEIGDAFEIVLCDAPHYSFKEQILLPLQLIKLKPDLTHFPHFNVPIFWWGKQIVTIHDLIKHGSKGPATTTRWKPFYWFKYLGYRLIVWLAVKKAAKVIVPSKWWKKELIRPFNLPPEKIVVIYEGVEENFQFRVSHSEGISRSEHFQLQRVLKKYEIKKPFIIYTGSLYPHKNVEQLVKAIKLLISQYPNISISLVIVCARNIFYKRFEKKIKQMEAEKFVNLVGFVPDKELVALYRQAKAFVFPSLLEGFGLPGLEAMAAGCPVLASDIPVLKEVYGKAAEYFDPLDVKNIAQKIKKICFNDLNLPAGKAGHRNRMIKKGLKQVKKYSWQKMAKETLRVYKNLAFGKNLVSH